MLLQKFSETLITFTLCCATLLSPITKAVAIAQNRNSGVVLKNPNPAAEAAWANRLSAIEPLHKQMKAALSQGNYTAAEGFSRKAISIDDKDAFSWLYFAESCDHQGKNSEAINAYRALVYAQGWSSNINTDPTTRLKYAIALIRSKQWPEAAAIYAQVFPSGAIVQKTAIPNSTFDSKRPDYVRFQAVCHLVLGVKHASFGPPLPGERLEHLKAATILQPKMALAHYFMGKELLKTSRIPEAKEAFQKAAQFGDGELKKKSEMMLYTFPKAASPKP